MTLDQQKGQENGTEQQNSMRERPDGGRGGDNGTLQAWRDGTEICGPDLGERAGVFRGTDKALRESLQLEAHDHIHHAEKTLPEGNFQQRARGGKSTDDKRRIPGCPGRTVSG